MTFYVVITDYGANYFTSETKQLQFSFDLFTWGIVHTLKTEIV